VKLIAFGIAWAGYVLVWFGWETLQGPGVGLMDLIVPGRTPGHKTAESIVAGGPSSVAQATSQYPNLPAPVGLGNLGQNLQTGPILGH
jgi:hypothetical protein